MGGDVVRVLIVEDDPAWTDRYVLYLRGDEDLRYETTVVDSGAAAIEIWAAALTQMRASVDYSIDLRMERRPS